MIKFINKKIINYYLSILFYINSNKFFKNIFELSTTNYNQRIINAEGFCEKRGIGYVNFIKENITLMKK